MFLDFASAWLKLDTARRGHHMFGRPPTEGLAGERHKFRVVSPRRTPQACFKSPDFEGEAR